MNYRSLAALACGFSMLACAHSQSVVELNVGIEVNAMSAGGVLAGNKTDPETWHMQGAFRAMGQEVVFSLSDTGYTNVLDVNNAMVMVGATAWQNRYYGFIRMPNGDAERYTFPGAEETTLNAVTDSGRMLGWQYTGSDNYGAFILERNGAAKPFVVPGYEDASWYDMNNRNQVMGSAFDYQTGITGLIYWMGNVQRVEYPGAEHTILVDMNNQGDVLGEAVMPYDYNLADSESYAFVRRGDGTIKTIDYQPNWPETITEEAGGEPVAMEFMYSLGTRARAIDDAGRVVFVSRAFYMYFGPNGPEFGTVKERVFATRLQ